MIPKMIRTIGVVTTLIMMATTAMAQRGGFQTAGIPQMVWPPHMMQPLIQGIPVALPPGAVYGVPVMQTPVIVTRGGFFSGAVITAGPPVVTVPQVYSPYANPYINPYNPFNPYANPYVNVTPYANPYAPNYANPYINSYVVNPYVNPYAVPPTVIINNPPQSYFGPPVTTVTPPPGPALPPPGTPRAQVLRQFGVPNVTIVTSNGETLYFNGGVTVIIQNGQVAGPR